MPRKPLLVQSKMVNICCQLFPSPNSILCFSKHLYLFVACKMAYKIYCLRAAEVGQMFSFSAKRIFLHVLTSVALRLTLYITTKYCSNRAISSSYISLFCCTDGSFTNNHRRSFCFYQILAM